MTWGCSGDSKMHVNTALKIQNICVPFENFTIWAVYLSFLKLSQNGKLVSIALSFFYIFPFWFFSKTWIFQFLHAFKKNHRNAPGHFKWRFTVKKKFYSAFTNTFTRMINISPYCTFGKNTVTCKTVIIIFYGLL